MKRNAFGEIVLQPGDDVGAAFMEAHDTDIDATLLARFIENDPNFGWTCCIEDENGNEVQAHDFESEADLRDWLAGAMVTVEDG